MFLEQNLEKKERSNTFQETEQGLGEEFYQANGEGLSADAKYSVFKSYPNNVYVYSIVNSCIEAKLKLERVQKVFVADEFDDHKYLVATSLKTKSIHIYQWDQWQQIYQSQPLTEEEIRQVQQDPKYRNQFTFGPEKLDLNDLFEGK